MKNFHLITKCLFKGSALLAGSLSNYIASAEDLAQSDTFAAIDCFWGVSGTPLAGNPTIGDKNYQQVQSIPIGEASLILLNEPMLNVPLAQRLYGKMPGASFPKSGNVVFNVLPAGTLLYVGLGTPDQKLAGFKGSNGQLQLLNNDFINMAIIQQAIGGPLQGLQYTPPASPQKITGEVAKGIVINFKENNKFELVCKRDADDNSIQEILPKIPTPDVSIVSISGNNNITNAGVQNIIKNCPNIVELRLENCGNVSDAGIEGLANLENCHSVSLLGCNITDQGVKNIPEEVKRLNISNTKITEKGLEEILTPPPAGPTWHGLPPMRYIKVLYLGGLQITPERIRELLKKHPLDTLEQLRLPDGTLLEKEKLTNFLETGTYPKKQG